MIEKFGQELEAKKNYKVLYTFSEQIHGYSYAIQNLSNAALDVLLDCSNS